VKRRLEELLGLVKGLLQEERIPKRDKIVLGGLLALLASPIDLIPDFLPLVGYLDDLIMVILVLDYLFARIPWEVMVDHYPWDPKGYQRIRRWARRLSGAIPSFLKDLIWSRVEASGPDLGKGEKEGKGS